MLASVDSAKALRKAISNSLATRERLRAQRQVELQEKLKQGLAGQKIGKYKVPENPIDVQLGEELSESLRGLKVSLHWYNVYSPVAHTSLFLARGQPVQRQVPQHATPCAFRAARYATVRVGTR